MKPIYTMPWPLVSAADYWDIYIIDDVFNSFEEYIAYYKVEYTDFKLTEIEELMVGIGGEKFPDRDQNAGYDMPAQSWKNYIKGKGLEGIDLETVIIYSIDIEDFKKWRLANGC